MNSVCNVGLSFVFIDDAKLQRPGKRRNRMKCLVCLNIRKDGFFRYEMTFSADGICANPDESLTIAFFRPA